jgi:hypothetical protein
VPYSLQALGDFLSFAFYVNRAVPSRNCGAGSGVLSDLTVLSRYGGTQDLRNPGCAERAKVIFLVTLTDWFQTIRKWL